MKIMVEFKEINKDPKSLEVIIKNDLVEIVGVISPEQKEKGVCVGIYNKTYLIYIRKNQELINIETYVAGENGVTQGKYIEISKSSKSFEDYDKKLKAVNL